MSERRRIVARKHAPTAAIVVALVAAIVMIGAGVIGWSTSFAAHPQGPRDLAGNVIVPDGGSAAQKPADVGGSGVEARTGLRLEVPSVGLNVPLAEMDEVDRSITPPGFQDAYLIRNVGTSLKTPNEGTVFVAMHSIRGGGVGPGNYLVDVETGNSKVPIGSTITVGSLNYTVVSSRSISKTAVPSDQSLWKNTPGRLVLLTCVQNAAGTESKANLLITATLQPAANG